MAGGVKITLKDKSLMKNKEVKEFMKHYNKMINEDPRIKYILSDQAELDLITYGYLRIEV